MVKNWSTETLQRFWKLESEEKALLGKKQGVQKFFYLLILKYYAIDYSFPTKIQDIPILVINFGFSQYGTNVTLDDIANFLNNHYSYSKYQKEIREFYGIQLFNNANNTILSDYLYKLALETQNKEKLESEFKIYLKRQKIELPSQKVITTLIKNTLLKVESYIFKSITNRIEFKAAEYIDKKLLSRDEESGETLLSFLKQDSGKSNRDSIANEISKLQIIKELNINDSLLPADVSPNVFKFYKRKILSDTPEQIRMKPDYIRYALVFIYCCLKQQEIVDNLCEHLINLVHKIKKNASKTAFALNNEIGKLSRNINFLYQVAEVARDKPDDIIQDVIYPIVSREQIDTIIKARYLQTNLKHTVQKRLIRSYSYHYRKKIFDILVNLEIMSDNNQLLSALSLIKKYQNQKCEFYSNNETVVVDDLINSNDIEFIYAHDNKKIRIYRKEYEYAILKLLRDKLKNKEAWLVGSFKYKNPEYDIPADFDKNKDYYYEVLNQPLLADEFNKTLQNKLSVAISTFDKNLPQNEYVSLTIRKNKPWIKLSPLPEQTKPQNLERLKDDILEKWQIINLLDILKEVDLRESFTSCFNSSGNREIISKEEIQKRLILCLYGTGTNTGLTRIASTATNKVSLEELKYIKRKFINQDNLRESITKVVNGVFSIRNPEIWGETTTACASDSRKFISWDQNLMTEWHARYHSAGVMIYWHVTKQSICIYSQLKTCSSSEVASMLQGVISHDTDVSVESQYVDSHGKSEVGFALTYLLGFDLLPRYATIGSQRIYLPHADYNCKNIASITTRPIKWELISTYYNEMIKFATALKVGTATADSIIRQFSRSNYQHPIFKAFIELGKAVKSIFLCRYFNSLELRQEIHSGLNIVENWNSVNDFIFYGKKSEISTNARDEQETSMLCLHLLQVCLAYINTLLIQDVLRSNKGSINLTEEDLRGLNPLIHQHVNPYGTFELDMNKRISLMEVA